MKRLHSSWWWLCVFSLAYGAIMLALDGRPFTQLYALSPYHRYQADALLHGHLYLADSMDALQPGLVWHNGHVQHVWGLGVGIWLAPFEWVWRLFGGQVFPDRAALGLAFTLLAFYSVCTGLRLARSGRCNIGLGLMWLTMLCPALWTLSRASRLIFEETVLYAILLSLAGFIAVARVALLSSRMDYFLCCALGAFSIWVRPTHAIYGLAAVLVGSLIVWARGRERKDIVLGVGGWLASLALLLSTNEVRFGSPTEFGHRLTVSTGSMVYLTRFGNPFKEATVFEATKELFSLLFITKPQGAAAFADNLFVGQSSLTRWRRLDLTAFDPIYALVCVGGIIATTCWLLSRRKERLGFWQQSQTVFVTSILLWSIVSVVGLGLFYLYYPVVASRYLLDFSPAWMGFAMLVWILLSTRTRTLCWLLLSGWLGYEIVSAEVPAEERYMQQPPIRQSLPPAKSTLENFNGCYTVDQHPATTRIAYNGQGWEPLTGFSANIVSMAIDQPEFLELRVSARRAFHGRIAGKDIFRAKIDGMELQLQELHHAEDQSLVKFRIPRSIREKGGIEMVFLSFSESYDVEDRHSERFLYEVRWR